MRAKLLSSSAAQARSSANSSNENRDFTASSVAPSCIVTRASNLPNHVGTYTLKSPASTTPPATWEALKALPADGGLCHVEDCAAGQSRPTPQTFCRQLEFRKHGSNCCCHFWPPPSPLPPCTASRANGGPCDAVLPLRQADGDVFVVKHRSTVRNCSRYAVSMSGEVRDWHRNLRAFEKFVVEGNDVELYAFLASNEPLQDEATERGRGMRELLTKPYLAAMILENSSVGRTGDCIASHAVRAFADVMQHRHNTTGLLPRWSGNWSAALHTVLSQARRVQLAFAMVEAAPCHYELVLRARPDLEWFQPLQWAAHGARLTRQPPELLILDDQFSTAWRGLPFGWRAGFPGNLVCWARDIAALGSMRALAGFATVYGDAGVAAFWRSVLVQQRDSSGYMWERIIKAHVHWCGVSVAYVHAPCRLSPTRADG